VTVRLAIADDLAGMKDAVVAALGESVEIVETQASTAPPIFDVVIGSSRAALAGAGSKRPAAVRVGLVASLGEASVVDWLPGSADRLLVAADAIEDALLAAGWPPGSVLTTGLPVAAGLSAPADVAGARAAAGLPAGNVVVVRPSAVHAWGLTPLLLQLGLVSSDPCVLFDIGLDAALADQLREAIPIHDLRAGLFASGEGHGRALALADVVIGAGTMREVAESLAVGAVTVAVDTDDAGAWSLAAQAGAVREVSSHGRLAVELDGLLAAEKLAAARVAARGLGRAGAAGAVADAIVDAARGAAEIRAARGRPVGLPAGIEMIGSRAARPSHPEGPKGEPDVEGELAALRERLAKGA